MDPDDLTPDQLRARLNALRDAETAALTGQRVEQVTYDGGTVRFASGATPLADIRRAIFETRALLGRATGTPFGGPFTPVFMG